MNKVICDVCGTDYPETASQCPICGCATVGGQTSLATAASGEEENSAYTPVKGGRFSKSNVRKRLKAGYVQESRIVEPEPDDVVDYEDDVNDVEQGGASNRGLIIIVVLLLVAIIAVSIYIAISIFDVGSDDVDEPARNPIVQIETPTAESEKNDDPVVTEATDKGIPCSSLTLVDREISLNEKGSVWMLAVTAKPVDTTDQMLFTSSDESVVTVDPVTGIVTAVGEGEAKVIVKCGDAKVECPVTCVFPTGPVVDDPDTSDPTEETDPDVTEPAETPDGFVLELRRFDFTMSTEGETFRLYNGDVSAYEITWTSEDESVATIENGIVTAVGYGTTKVIAEYDGQKAVCIVRCNLPKVDEEENTEPTEPSEDTETTEPTDATAPTDTTEGTEGTETTEPDTTAPAYVLRKNNAKCPYGDDFSAHATISIGESFKLAIVDADKKAQDVTWTASKEGVCSVTGTTVKGTSAGKVTLSVTFEGNTYTCEIIVR